MFKNIINLQPEPWVRLQEWRKKLPHALLVKGPKGIGKTELATVFAQSLLCETPLPNGQSCHTCQACHWFSQGNHPDFRTLSPKALQTTEADKEGSGEKTKRSGQQITIDQVRELDDFFTVGTHRQGLRIILISPAENLNHNAANAILKVLEEPPPSTLFLMVSSEALRLLPTLRSRCQALSVSFPPLPMAIQMLESDGIANPEVWLALAGGAPNRAMDLAKQLEGDWLNALTQALAAGDKLEVIASATTLEKPLKAVKGENPLPLLVDCAQRWLVDMNLAAHGLKTRYYLQQHAKIAALTQKTSPERLVRLYRQLVRLRRESEYPLNIRLFLEQFFFNYRALFTE